MSRTAYIGVGSNMGDKVGNCLRAMDMVDRMEGCRVEARSPFYRTEPVGVEGQDWYVNAVFSLRTHRDPEELLKGLLAVEAALGRERKEKWGPRPIDLDILLLGDDVIHEPDLTVPHPLMHTRRFVLEPMAGLAPNLVHPVLRQTMAELLKSKEVRGQDVVLLEKAP